MRAKGAKSMAIKTHSDQLRIVGMRERKSFSAEMTRYTGAKHILTRRENNTPTAQAQSHIIERQRKAKTTRKNRSGSKRD